MWSTFLLEQSLGNDQIGTFGFVDPVHSEWM